MDYDEKNNIEDRSFDSISAFDDDETGDTEIYRPVSGATKRIINPDFIEKSRHTRGKKKRMYGASSGSKQSQTDNIVYPPMRKYEAPRNTYKPYNTKKRAKSGSIVLSVLEPIFVLLSIASAALVFVDGVPLYAILIANIVEVVIYLIVFARRGGNSHTALLALYFVAAFVLLVLFIVYISDLMPHIREIARLQSGSKASLDYLDGVKNECVFAAVVALIITVVLSAVALLYEKSTGSPSGAAALLALIGGFILFFIILDFTVAQNMPQDASSVYEPSFFLLTIIGGVLETIPGGVYAVAVFFISDKINIKK